MKRTILLMCGCALLVGTLMLPSAKSTAADGDVPKSDQAEKPADDPARDEDIRKLLKLTGSDLLAQQVMDQMIVQFRQNTAGVPPEFWEEFRKEVNLDDMNEMVVPIYAKHLTHDDIKELIKFYESPVGRKLTTALPQITQECMAVGETWGRGIGERAVKKLKEKGLIKE